MKLVSFILAGIFGTFLIGLLLVNAQADVLGPPRVSPYSAPGSIFPASNMGKINSFVADPIAYSIGDSVTIIVNLSTVANISKQLNTAKTATVNDSVTSLLIPNNVNFGNQWSGAQAFKGGGSQADTEGLTTTIQAQITEILPNDTYKIEATRTFQAGKEKSTMTLTGLIRRQDLASDNSISSTQVAQLQVRQDGIGDLSRSERKGWLTSVYEFINPF